MDKLIVDARGNTTISNDGATIMKLLDIVHPAARLLVDIAKSQDAEVGDGTTSVVLFAGELLKELRPLIEENVSPRVLISGLRKACDLAVGKIGEISFSVDQGSAADFRSLLEQCAGTSMNSKIISHQKEFFTKMVVDAVLCLDSKFLNERLIGIKKIPGGALQDSLLVDGVAFKRTFAYAGFEQQPRKFEAPRILSLNIELELKAERANAEVRIQKVGDFQSIVNAEWSIIYEKLDKIVATGAQIVLSRLPIGDLATQYFADRGIFCAGRVPVDDLERVIEAVGGSIQSTVNDLSAEHLGTCDFFEERQVGGDRFNIFSGCPLARTCTILLRGGSEQFISEVERSLHDAIMIVKRTLRFPTIVAGGGACEMEISRFLRASSASIHGKLQLIIMAFAKALEVIPRQICENSGLDAPDVMNRLRKRHFVDQERWCGVDLAAESGIGDNFAKFVWEPSLVKTNMLRAATEAAIVLLSVDETISASKPSDSNSIAMQRR